MELDLASFIEEINNITIIENGGTAEPENKTLKSIKSHDEMIEALKSGTLKLPMSKDEIRKVHYKEMTEQERKQEEARLMMIVDPNRKNWEIKSI